MPSTLPACLPAMATACLLLIYLPTTLAQVYATYDYVDYNGKSYSVEPQQYYNDNNDNDNDYSQGVDYDYSYTNYDAGSNSYGGSEYYSVITPAPTECFTCHFSKKGGTEQGMANCDDPFIEKGIPLVVCDGQCARTITLLEGEYLVIRSCLPNCKDVSDAKTSVRCCEGTRCNGAEKSRTARLGASWTLCVLGALVGGLARR